MSPTKQKQALTCDDLHLVMRHYQSSSLHDDLLFIAQLLTGFFASLWLGDLMVPDNACLHNPSKVTKWSSITVDEGSFVFFLLSHKGNKFFGGNTVILMKSPYRDIPTFHHFHTYLASCDHLFPFSSLLWLASDGSVSTRSFFLQQLHFLSQFFHLYSSFLAPILLFSCTLLLMTHIFTCDSC